MIQYLIHNPFSNFINCFNIFFFQRVGWGERVKRKSWDNCNSINNKKMFNFQKKNCFSQYNFHPEWLHLVVIFLMSFNLEEFFNLSLFFLPWFLKTIVSYFVEYPSLWVWCFLVMRLRLCNFGRKYQQKVMYRFSGCIFWLEIKPVTFWFTGRCSIHWATPARAEFSFLKIISYFSTTVNTQ